MENRRTLKELRFREALCVGVIDYLKTHASNDPRLPAALQEYERQLASIRQQIHDIQPPPVVVRLKTAILFPKAGEENGRY